jgi:TolB-like protein/Tfp pilus assembly protein PilF
LGENPNDHRYIVTIPRRGYSFVAQVKELNEEESPEPGGSIADLSNDSDKAEINESESPESNSMSAVHRLRLPVFVGILVLTISISAAWFFIRFCNPVTPKTINSIAVLPFKNLNDKDSQYMEVGMADALIRKLSEIDHIRVRPTISVLNFSDNPVDPVIAGRKLGVDAVLNGTIQHFEDRVRVSLQLIDVADGEPVWADRFDEKLSHPFVMQDSISEHVIKALGIKIGVSGKDRDEKQYAKSAEAHQLYLRGMQQWNKRSYEAWLKSISYFQQAIEKDALYAPAYAGIADAYCLLAIYFGPNPVKRASMFEKAREMAKKALDIDSNVAQAYATLAMIEVQQDRNIFEAERSLKRAIDIDPTLVVARQRYAFILAKMGRLDESLNEIQHAVESDPLAALANSNLAYILYLSGQYDRSVEWCIKALELDERSGLAIATLGLCYLQKGLNKEAIEEFYSFYKDADQNPHAIEFLGYAYATNNRRRDALKMVSKLKTISEYNASALYGMAIIYAGLGEIDKALSIFEEALSSKAYRQYILRFDPRLQRLRNIPRFEKIAMEIDTQMI